MSRRTVKPEGLPIIHARAAGVDIGSRFHVVAIGPDLSDEPVRTFQALTTEIERIFATMPTAPTGMVSPTKGFWVNRP